MSRTVDRFFLTWFAIGLVVGLATVRKRDRFGGTGEENALAWLAMCGTLWPLVLLQIIARVFNEFTEHQRYRLRNRCGRRWYDRFLFWL